MDPIFYFFLATLGFVILIIGAIKKPVRENDRDWLWIIPFMGN
ncbi:MAG: hypothetical protein ACXAB7_01210 [Candidatus Kariarchaeaceae archaeon]|jgi:hypothetical protein